MSMARLFVPLAAVLVSIPGMGQSPKPPAEAGFLSHWGEIRLRVYEGWGTATIPSYGANQVSRYGRHWNLYVATPGFKDRNAIWAAVKPYAMQAGWTVVSENPNGGLLV